MCMTAGRAADSCDGQDKDFIRELYLTLVGTVKNKRAGKSTGTLDLIEINRIDYIIIKILRNMVVVFCFNCYHRKDHDDSASYDYGCGWSRNQTLVGEISAF